MTPEVALSVLAVGALAATHALSNNTHTMQAARVNVKEGYLEYLSTSIQPDKEAGISTPSVPGLERGPRGRG